MPIKLQSVVLCIGMTALSQVAAAAGAAVEKAPVAQAHAERDARPGKQRNHAEKQGARPRGDAAASGLEQELATISAQANAAEAACASQPGESREACRKQVNADRERATAAIRRKHEQGVRRN